VSIGGKAKLEKLIEKAGGSVISKVTNHVSRPARELVALCSGALAHSPALCPPQPTRPAWQVTHVFMSAEFEDAVFIKGDKKDEAKHGEWIKVRLRSIYAQRHALAVAAPRLPPCRIGGRRTAPDAVPHPPARPAAAAPVPCCTSPHLGDAQRSAPPDVLLARPLAPLWPRCGPAAAPHPPSRRTRPASATRTSRWCLRRTSRSTCTTSRRAR
jgi:hypothetical protein